MGLDSGHDILEIGSGIGRDSFQLIEIVVPITSCMDVDVTREAILWCQEIATKTHRTRVPPLRRPHEFYNPLGTQISVDFTLQTSDKLIDRISISSMFAPNSKTK